MQRKRFNGAVLQETSEPLLENQHHRGDSRDADSRIGLLGGDWAGLTHKVKTYSLAANMFN